MVKKYERSAGEQHAVKDHLFRSVYNAGPFMTVLTTGVQAQEIEPRAYSNAPVGVNFLIASYAYAEGGVAIDPSLPVTISDIQSHAAILAYARSMDVWGRSGKLSAIVP